MLEDLADVAIAGHQRTFDRASRDLGPVLQLPLVKEVEGRAQEHVTAVEDLVQVGVDRAEHALVREVLGAAGLGEHLEVDGSDEVRLHGALGELSREDARLSRVAVDDSVHHPPHQAALRRSGGAGEKDVLARQERQRNLIEHLTPFDEGAVQLVEEGPKVRDRRLEISAALPHRA